MGKMIIQMQKKSSSKTPKQFQEARTIKFRKMGELARSRTRQSRRELSRCQIGLRLVSSLFLHHQERVKPLSAKDSWTNIPARSCFRFPRPLVNPVARKNTDPNIFFVTPDEFKKGIDRNEFAEWALVHGNYYGTTKKSH